MLEATKRSACLPSGPAAFRARLGWLCLPLACACHGSHLHAGPVVAYSITRGASLGWEAGAGELGVVRVNVGGSYRLQARAPIPARANGDVAAAGTPAAPPQYVHYAALEPLGLSLGIDVDEHGETGLMGGFWAGWVYDPNPTGPFGTDFENHDPLRPEFDCPNYDPEPGFLLSWAVGVRYLGGAWEAYATPKAVLLYCLEFAN
jgi:hypothetical protein